MISDILSWNSRISKKNRASNAPRMHETEACIANMRIHFPSDIWKVVSLHFVAFF